MQRNDASAPGTRLNRPRTDAAPILIESNNLFGADFPFHISRDALTDRFPPHRHDFIEMSLVAEGGGTERINGAAHVLEPGSLSVLFPWHVHELLPDAANPLVILKCSFGMQALLEGPGRADGFGRSFAADLGAIPHHRFTPREFETLRALFAGLLEEYKGAGLWKEELMRARATEALILFDRARRAAQPGVAPIDGDAAPGGANVWAIVDLIHLRYMEGITLEELSGLFHYSGSHINRLLKQHTGLTFDGLVNEIRTRNACGLLRYTDIPVGYLAGFLGYPSAEAFSRAFKSRKGQSPEHYRKASGGAEGRAGNPAYPSSIDFRIIYYIHLKHHEDITLAAVAKEFHYSEKYLSDLFMSQTGQGFSDFLQEVRVFHAAALLGATDKPVVDIGFEVGFNSTETFQRSFKKLRGMTPGELRNSIRENR